MVRMDVLEEVEKFTKELTVSSFSAPVYETPINVCNFIQRYDNYLIDCDGVLWREGKLLPNVKEALQRLRNEHKKLFFVTNNSTRSRAQFLQKFTSFGIECHMDELFPSCFAAAEYISSNYPNIKKAFIVGSSGIKEELEAIGVSCIGHQDPHYAQTILSSEDEFMNIDIDPNVGAVVCGWDWSFNFYKLCCASLYLQKNENCVFIATNRDPWDRLEGGRNIPGNGCALRAIEEGSQRKAVNVGKPSKWLINYLLEARSLNPSRTVMIGDRLDTDIQFGNIGNVDTALVLTGCTIPNDVIDMSKDDILFPTCVLPHFGLLSEEYSNTA